MSASTLDNRAWPPQLADYRRPLIGGLVLVGVAFGVFGTWAACAPLDSAAIAQGHIEVDSRRKVIQHLEGGIVREVLVREAEVVRQGQVLIRLDPTRAHADAEIVRKQRIAAATREARLLAELNGAVDVAFPRDVMEQRTIPEIATAISDELRHFAERRQSLGNQLHMAETRLEQARQQIAGRSRQHAALAAQLASLNGELASLKPLMEKGWHPRNRYLASEREKSRMEGELGQAAADIARLGKQQEEAQLQKDQISQKFREEVARELAEVRIRLSELREKLSIAGDVLGRSEMRAPIAGVVQNLRISGIGAVIKPGEAVADLVPADDELIIAAHVSPLDIDSVSAGVIAEIRFSSMSTRRISPVFGRVESISADALTSEASRQPYYLARIRVDQGALPPRLAKKLTPGMPADVVIASGDRSLLDYLLGPLRDAISKGMREE
jgi:HlyD family secretion protein